MENGTVLEYLEIHPDADLVRLVSNSLGLALVYYY